MGADELTLLLQNRLTRLIPDLHCHSQTRCLYFTGPDRKHRTAPHKARQNIGSTTDGRQAQIGFKRFVDVMKTLM